MCDSKIRPPLVNQKIEPWLTRQKVTNFECVTQKIDSQSLTQFCCFCLDISPWHFIIPTHFYIPDITNITNCESHHARVLVHVFFPRQHDSLTRLFLLFCCKFYAIIGFSQALAHQYNATAVSIGICRYEWTHYLCLGSENWCSGAHSKHSTQKENIWLLSHCSKRSSQALLQPNNGLNLSIGSIRGEWSPILVLWSRNSFRSTCRKKCKNSELCIVCRFPTLLLSAFTTKLMH